MSESKDKERKEFNGFEKDPSKDLDPRRFAVEQQQEATPSQLSSMSYCMRYAWMKHKKLAIQTKAMVKGRKLHQGIEKFNLAWTHRIKEYQRMKKRQLTHYLKSIRDRIVQDIHRDKQYQRNLQALLKNLCYFIEETAEQIIEGTRFNTAALLSTFWGGIPKFEYPPREMRFKTRADALGLNGSEFIVHEFKTGKTPESPYEGHVLQAVATGIDLESYKELRGTKCTEVRIIYPEKIFRIPVTPQLKRKVDYDRGSYAIICKLSIPPPILNDSRCESCGQRKICLTLDEKFNVELSTQSNEVDQNQAEESSECTVTTDETGFSPSPPPPTPTLSEEKANEQKYLGNIIQSNKYPFILKNGRDNEVWAIIKEQMVEEAKAGDLVVFENQEIQLKLIADIVEIKTFPAKAMLNYASTSELVTFAKLNPMREVHKDSTLISPSGRNYLGFKVRKTTPEEILVFFSLNRSGIPLGVLQNKDEELSDGLSENAVPYYYPLEKENQGYKGIFVTGTPGKGKTNFLKLLACQIPEYFGGGTPPAIIILDIEGEYSMCNQPTTGSTFDQEFWERFNLQPVSRLDHYYISKMGLEGDTTLRFETIDPREISLLFPALPEKSRQMFEQITRHAMTEYEITTFYEFREAVKKILNKFSDIFGIPLHDSQRDAILRALYTGIEDIFDQTGKYLDVEKLIFPGIVSVIDCSGLTDIRLARQVALYLFLAVKKYKIDIKNKDFPVLIVFDEAHELFPRSTKDDIGRDYLQRVTNQVESILRIGRKRMYGFIFASQMPQDVSVDIVDLCQTKVIMGLENERWISKVLGSKWVKKILNLQKGQAIIHCPEFHSEPMKIRVPKAPCKHQS